MIDREDLEAALERFIPRPGNYDDEQWEAVCKRTDAARERLAQLPEKCATCQGRGWMADAYAAPEEIAAGYKRHPCSVCHGKGGLYPSALVERVRRSLLRVAGEVASDGSFWCPDIAVAVVAVFDALNGETE